MTADRWANWPEAHHDGDDVRLYHGSALDVLATLPAGAAQCVVTSPPYYGLRDYGVPGQLGLEPSPAEYVAALVEVLDQGVGHALAGRGVLWLNLGDSYSGRANGGPSFDRHRGSGHRAGVVAAQINTTGTAPYKSLLGIPWRVAFALIDAGWALRNEVIWHKPNAMPESVADRLSARHETLFLFTKGPRYDFDLDAIKVPTTGLKAGNTDADRTAYGEASGVGRDRRFGGNKGSTLLDQHETRNPGDVWTITTKPYHGAHFAVMPYDLARRCILAGAPAEGSIVLDPFAGACTTLMAARQLGRRGVGVELNADFLPLGVERLGDPTLAFT